VSATHALRRHEETLHVDAARTEAPCARGKVVLVDASLELAFRCNHLVTVCKEIIGPRAQGRIVVGADVLHQYNHELTLNGFVHLSLSWQLTAREDVLVDRRIDLARALLPRNGVEEEETVVLQD